MAKYSQEFKLEVVQYYLSGHGKRRASAKFQIAQSDVRKWVLAYEHHGEDGLAIKKTKANYSMEFKLRVIQTVLDEGLSLFDAAQRFNIGNKGTVIVGWLHQYKEYGIDGLKPKPKGRPKQMPKPQRPGIHYSQADRAKTQEQLLEELAYLRAEVALLKKRRALRLEQEAKEAAEQQCLRYLYQD